MGKLPKIRMLFVFAALMLFFGLGREEAMAGSTGRAAPAEQPAGVSLASPSPAPPDSSPEPQAALPALQTVSVFTAPTEAPSAFLSIAGVNGQGVEISGSRYAVSFSYLRQCNDQIKGWLYREGQLNVPVLQEKDNTFYLNHLLDRSLGANGSVFLDAAVAGDESDVLTTVFGDPTEDGGPFCFLRSYGEQEYYSRNDRMLYLTPDGAWLVQWFAGYQTDVKEETSWKPEKLDTQADFEAFVKSLTARSAFLARRDAVPQWGDRLLALVSQTKTPIKERYLLFGRMRKIQWRDSAPVFDLTKKEMDERPTQNGKVTVDGVGEFVVYAQNDELWADFRFEAAGSVKKRKFYQGGCGPTAAAMAIANLVEESRLPALGAYASSSLGYTFCECSVNQQFCTRRHLQYQLSTPEEYLRYFPLAVASFASGNNCWGVVSRGEGQGTNMRFLENLCQVYDLSMTTTRVAAEAIEMLQQGNGRRVVLSCATRGSPFTNGGHYVVMVAADEEYVYFLDPQRENSYEKYLSGKYVEELGPGVVRIRVEYAVNCNLSPHYVLERK